jgi:hypothetical protein
MEEFPIGDRVSGPIAIPIHGGGSPSPLLSAWRDGSTPDPASPSPASAPPHALLPGGDGEDAPAHPLHLLRSPPRSSYAPPPRSSPTASSSSSHLCGGSGGPEHVDIWARRCSIRRFVWWPWLRRPLPYFDGPLQVSPPCFDGARQSRSHRGESRTTGGSSGLQHWPSLKRWRRPCPPAVKQSNRQAAVRRPWRRTPHPAAWR